MNNKYFTVKTDKPLCPYDAISYNTSFGQLLIIKEEIKPLKYKVEIATNSEEEKLNIDKFKKGVTLFKIFNVMGKEKNSCTNDTSEFTLINIK
jgi:hypothetical protein